MSLSTGSAVQSATNNNHHHSGLHNHHLHHQHNLQHLQQQQQSSHPHLLIPQPSSMQLHPPQEELNFSTFMDLCRFCSLKPGQKLNIFEKEAEHRQLLYKVRSVLPSVVRVCLPCVRGRNAMQEKQIIFLSNNFRSPKMTSCQRRFAIAAWSNWRT